MKKYLDLKINFSQKGKNWSPSWCDFKIREPMEDKF